MLDLLIDYLRVQTMSFAFLLVQGRLAGHNIAIMQVLDVLG